MVSTPLGMKQQALLFATLTYRSWNFVSRVVKLVSQMEITLALTSLHWTWSGMDIEMSIWRIMLGFDWHQLRYSFMLTFTISKNNLTNKLHISIMKTFLFTDREIDIFNVWLFYLLFKFYRIIMHTRIKYAENKMIWCLCLPPYPYDLII